MLYPFHHSPLVSPPSPQTPAMMCSIYLIKVPSLLSGGRLISPGAQKAEVMSLVSGPRADEPLGVKVKRISNILCVIT